MANLRLCRLSLCERGASRYASAEGGNDSFYRRDAVAFSSAKFAQRGMAYALADDLGPKGIHVAHIIIDGLVDTSQVRERHDLEGEPAIDPTVAAETYWQLTQQPPCAWTFELDLRHHAEKLME